MVFSADCTNSDISAGQTIMSMTFTDNLIVLAITVCFFWGVEINPTLIL